MKSLTRLLPLLLALATSPAVMAETATASSAASAENPTARLRVFSQNGSITKIYPKQACLPSDYNPPKPPIQVGGNIGTSFLSFIGLAGNDSLGMPQTRTVETMSDRGGFGNSVFYQEKVIPADAPIAIRLEFTNIHTDRMCVLRFNFDAQAGKDYEIDFSNDGTTCLVSINDIIQNNGEVTLETVPLRKAELCPS